MQTLAAAPLGPESGHGPGCGWPAAAAACPLVPYTLFCPVPRNWNLWLVLGIGQAASRLLRLGQGRRFAARAGPASRFQVACRRSRGLWVLLAEAQWPPGGTIRALGPRLIFPGPGPKGSSDPAKSRGNLFAQGRRIGLATRPKPEQASCGPSCNRAPEIFGWKKENRPAARYFRFLGPTPQPACGL